MAHDSPPDCRPNSDLALQDGQGEPSEIQQQKSASRSGGTRACDACRRRKIRCDAVGGPNGTESALAEQPCTLCTSQGVPCHFEYRPVKRAPAKGYVESLEKRLEAMESLLSSLSVPPNSAVADHGVSTSPEPLQSLPAKTSSAAPTSWNNPVVPRDSTSGPSVEVPRYSTSGPPFEAPRYPASGPSVEALRTRVEVSEAPAPVDPGPAATDLDTIQRLSDRLDDLVIDHDRYVGRETGLHLIQSVHEHLSVEKEPHTEQDKPVVDLLVEELHNTLQHTTTEVPPDLAPQLIEAYFTKAEWGFTLLPRPFFHECLERGLLETDRSFRSLYYAICAVGARFVDDPRLLPQNPLAAGYPEQLQLAKGFDLYWASAVQARSPLMAPSLFDLIQSAITIVWTLGSTGFLTSWTVTGFAVRRAVDAGCHREARSRWAHSPLEDQLRRRVFHMIFSIDQWISATVGRPTAMSKDDADVALPLEITDEELWGWELSARQARAYRLPSPPPPTIPEGRVCMAWEGIVSLFDIMETARKMFYAIKRKPATEQTTAANLRHIDAALNAWLNAIPPERQWNPAQQDDATVAHSAFVSCHYFWTQIYVHRDFISPSRSHALGYPSLAIATNAARACARILDTLRQRHCLDRTFGWAPMVAMQSGMMLLLAVFATPSGPVGASRTTLTPSAAADVKRCLLVLSYFSDKTYMAKKCFEGLSQLARMVVTPPASGRSSTSTPSEALRSSMKRTGADDWTDGRSPTDSNRGTGSDKQSPVDSGHGSSEYGHKARRTDGGGNQAQALPFSTRDLSSQTFNGRPTFLFDQPAPAPTSAPAPSFDPHPAAPPLSGAVPTSAATSDAFAFAPFGSDFASQPVPAEASSGQHVTPTLANPTSQDFPFAPPLANSPDVLSALYASGGAYDSSSFWQLALDDPLAVPQTVEQVASDLMVPLGYDPNQSHEWRHDDSWSAFPAASTPSREPSAAAYDASFFGL